MIFGYINALMPFMFICVCTRTTQQLDRSTGDARQSGAVVVARSQGDKDTEAWRQIDGD